MWGAYCGNKGFLGYIVADRRLERGKKEEWVGSWRESAGGLKFNLRCNLCGLDRPLYTNLLSVFR
jgi:hypothetical protein